MYLSGRNAGKLTTAALMSALSAALVCAANIIPTTKLAFLGIAGFAGCVVVAESGPIYGFAVYVVSSVLAFMFAPTTGTAYIAFFGWYPSVKCIIERIKGQKTEWCVKILTFSVIFGIVYILFPQIITSGAPQFCSLGIVLYLAACAAFVLYDICLSMMISYYLRVIYPKIRK